MGYVVLARKWRPQTFDDLTGQAHVSRTLSNAILRQRVPHAMLFTGARGVGKTTSARIVAMALNCAAGPTPAPCGTCDACREIQAGRATDVMEIDGASNRGINEIRELRDSVRYAPQRDRYKIYIIDEVHMLTTEAFNALLKTLEEPPPHVVFIFATTEVQKIPVTILSRCQRFDFRRIPHNEIVGRLRHIVDAEGIRIDADVLGMIARQAEGGMRDALSLLDQVITFSGGDVTPDNAATILGVADRRRLFELSEAILARDAARALHILHDIAEYGLDLGHFAAELVHQFRDLAVVAVSADPARITTLTDSELAMARRQVATSDPATLHRLFEITVQATEEIARSLHARVLFEMLLVRLTAVEPVHALGPLVERIEAIASGRRLPPPPTSAPPTATPAPVRTAPSEPAPAPVRTAPPAPAPEPARTAPPEPAPAPARTAPPEPAPAPVRTAAPEPAPAPVRAAPPEPKPAPVRAAPPDPAPAPEPAPVRAAPPDPAPEPAPAPVQTAAPEPEPAPVRAAPPAPAPVQTAAPEPAPSPAPVQTDPARSLTPDEWRQLVDALDASASASGRLMARATLLPGSTSGRIRLASSDIGSGVQREALAKLLAIAEQMWGFRPRIDVSLLDQVHVEELRNGFQVEEAERRETEEEERRAREAVLAHPATRSLLERWPEARISIHIRELREDSPQ